MSNHASRHIDHAAQVVVLGAGPVGLTIANFLGQKGIDVLVLEKLDKLVDYPRAIGIDDEALRTIQSIGLVEKVLPHTTPHHAMRFLTPSGRCFADIQPMTDEFGFSRRNAFIQPQIDAALFEGLSRFPNVRVLFSREFTSLEQDADGVTLQVEAPNGDETVRADWLVACDGGSSLVRRTLGVSYDGETAPDKWIVVDVANDPIGTPNIYLCCDPQRPYVSAALPHGIRRFEFLVMPNETEEELGKPESMRKLLGKLLPHPENVDLIRSRVYTHNARLAGKFRVERVLLAGDAAHIMPVWQGQGYNSGIRDAFNLSWKLALVVQGKAKPALLDTYQAERRDHAKAMIDLSVLAGKVLNPPKKWQAAARDAVSWLLNYFPPVKRYFLEMRFKPMPQYKAGAIVQADKPLEGSPVGKLFIQPKVVGGDGKEVLLDEIIGGGKFAFVAWGTDPTHGLREAQVAFWQDIGATFIRVLPAVQLQAQVAPARAGVVTVGDANLRLKAWFGLHPYSIAIVRPDRFVAAVATPQTIGTVSDQLAGALAAAQPA